MNKKNSPVKSGIDRELREKLEKYSKTHLRRKRWQWVVSGLCAFVIFWTTYALILPAITVTKGELTGYYCGLEEHVHTDECYSHSMNCGYDASARTLAEEYKNKLPTGIIGSVNATLLAAAKSQVGYRDYKAELIDLDGETVEKMDPDARTYSFFGDYFGDAYGNWNGAFAAYLLNYMGLTSLPAGEAVSVAMLAELFRSRGGLLRNDYTDPFYPEPGTLVFLGENEAAGIVVRVAEEDSGTKDQEGAPVIETRLVFVAGDVEGKVFEISCQIDDPQITAYGILSGLGETIELYSEMKKSEHTHSPGCFDKVLSCIKPEHTHTDACTAEPEREAKEEWELDLPSLTGDRRTDILSVAKSQIGYRESDIDTTVIDGAVHGYMTVIRMNS